jgi:hypothetical protein
MYENPYYKKNTSAKIIKVLKKIKIDNRLLRKRITY